MMKHLVGRFLVVFLLLVVAEVVGAQTLVANHDAYDAAEGQILLVEFSGVLENDTLDGGELPPTAEAELMTTVTHGFLHSGCGLCRNRQLHLPGGRRLQRQQRGDGDIDGFRLRAGVGRRSAGHRWIQLLDRIVLRGEIGPARVRQLPGGVRK